MKPPASVKLLGNVERIETSSVVSIVEDKEEKDSTPADVKGKEVTAIDHSSEAGVSGSNASTPELPAQKLEDHNVGGPEGHAVLYHIDEPQFGESSNGFLSGLTWCISIIATFFLSVLNFPYQFLVQVSSILSSVVSLYLGFRTDPHEPLQRRILQLETEIDRLKPLQEVFPKHNDPVTNPDQKLSILETELANTRKTIRSVLSKQQELYAVLERMKEYKYLHAQDRCW